MAEVHLTQRDRSAIARMFALAQSECPKGVRRGTWTRLGQGTLTFLDLAEWVPCWATFPLALRRALLDGPRTAPNDKDYPANPVGLNLPEGDLRPWNAADW
jgi:hypothetical protein